MKDKIKALAKHLDCKKKEITQSSYDEDTFEYEGEEYLVLTDDEADVKLDQYLDSYIDDCVLPEIPECYRPYFDEEAFKEACESDGRGYSLASYDGHENEQDGFYIYRTN